MVYVRQTLEMSKALQARLCKFFFGWSKSLAGHTLFTRPGVAGAVLQTPLSLTD